MANKTDIKWKRPPGVGGNTHWCERHRRTTSFVPHTGQRCCHPDRSGDLAHCRVAPCTWKEAIERRAAVEAELAAIIEEEAPLPYELYDHVEEFRLDLGLTADAFCRLIGLNAATYSNFTHGRYPLCLKARRRLKALGMSPGVLLAREPDREF